MGSATLQGCDLLVRLLAGADLCTSLDFSAAWLGLVEAVLAGLWGCLS